MGFFFSPPPLFPRGWEEKPDVGGLSGKAVSRDVTCDPYASAPGPPPPPHLSQEQRPHSLPPSLPLLPQLRGWAAAPHMAPYFCWFLGKLPGKDPEKEGLRRGTPAPKGRAAPGPAAAGDLGWVVCSRIRPSVPKSYKKPKRKAGGGRRGLGGCQGEVSRPEHEQRVWGIAASLPHLPLSAKSKPGF